MLYTVDKKQIEYIPHKEHYDYWRKNLKEENYDKIMIKLESILDNDQVLTSSFIPGSNWDYPFYHIYEACSENYDDSALFFGLLMWIAVMKHNDNWSFVKYDENNIKGMTYFRISI